MRQLVVAVGQRRPGRDSSLPRAAAAAAVAISRSVLRKPSSRRDKLRERKRAAQPPCCRDLNSPGASARHAGINRMNRTGLVIAFAVAAAVGLIFGLRPDLDLKLAALFFDPERGGFWRAYDPTYLRARDAAVWLTTLVAMPASITLAIKFVRPRR